MFNALFVQKLFFKKLFRLIRKHGIALVLQGLIEFAKTDEKDSRMKVLSEDLQKALDRYKDSGKKNK